MTGGSVGQPVGGVELAEPPVGALREGLRELPFGVPLDEFMEAEFNGIALAQLAQCLVARFAPFRRPHPPGTRIFSAQCLEGGKARERVTPLLPISFEVLAAEGATVCREISIGIAQS